MSFFSLLWQRINSETPAFFKKVIGFGVTIGGIGLGLVAIPNIPERLQEIGGYMITAGAICAAVAKSTTSNTTLAEKSEELLGKK